MAEVGMANLFPPLISYQLRRLGYTGVESLTGYFSSMYAAGMCVGAPLVAILGQFISVSSSPTYESHWTRLTNLYHMFQNKRYLLMGNLVLLACAMVVYLFVQNVPGMYIARCLQGIASVGIWSFGPGLISDNVNPARGGFFIALSMTGFSVKLGTHTLYWTGCSRVFAINRLATSPVKHSAVCCSLDSAGEQSASMV